MTSPRRRRHSHGLWLGLGYALMTAALAGWAWLTISRFQTATRAEEQVFSHHGMVVTQVERLRTAEEHAAVEARSYLMTGYDPLLVEREAARQRFVSVAAGLRGRLDDHGRTLLRKIVDGEAALDVQFTRAVEVKRIGGTAASGVGAAFVASQESGRRSMERAFEALRAHQDRVLASARERSKQIGSAALVELLQVAACALLITALLALVLTRAFRAIRTSEAQLANANEDLDAFAGRVAHDLRSVLGGLPIIAATLKREPTTAAQALAERIDKITKRAKGVIDGLLAFSRAGQPPEPMASAAAASIAADAIDDLLPLAQAQHIAVEADLEDAHARCTPALLHVALMNLLSNAIKFSAGERERRVRVSTRREQGRCVVLVEDSGPGIPPEALPHIFEPFYRAPGAKTEGAGLGLATVRRIVEAHGGGVDVQSQVGRGTVARLWFPVVEAMNSSPVVTPPSLVALAPPAPPEDIRRPA